MASLEANLQCRHKLTGQAAMAMATAMASTTSSAMALHRTALANSVLCSSLSVAPLRSASLVNVFGAEGLSFRSGGEARSISFKRYAKFQQFSQDAAEESVPELNEAPEAEQNDAEQILPQNLETAMIHAGESTGLYINSGGTRVIAELLVPELVNLDEDGAQQRVWDLSRLFLDTLQETVGEQRVKAIFPDAGVAAFVKYQWKDVPYSFGSLNDRRPVSNEDEIVVLISPDHQGLPDVERINSTLAGDDDTPARAMVMLNPRLVSGDVGVGLNVRRMRERLLSKFTTVYSVAPRPEATIFRQYPGLWQIFTEDSKQPGRLILAKEQPSRPTLDDIDGEEVVKMVNKNRQPWQMLLASLPLLTVLCVQLVSRLFNSITVNHNHKTACIYTSFLRSFCVCPRICGGFSHSTCYMLQIVFEETISTTEKMGSHSRLRQILQ